MSAYLLEWLGLLGRWVHLVTGIAWIGSSFYFVWLDDHLRPAADPQLAARGVGGELWSVHGGGFYNAHKYRSAPAMLPRTLHWFYWEAYATFLSGFLLLCLLYYGHAEIYLIDPAVAALSKPVAIVIGLAYLLGGWLVYDLLCRTALARRGPLLAAVLGILSAAAAYSLCQLFSGRGAFIQFGAMLGTIMVANVFFMIIPGQRAMVHAKQDGREPDPIHGQRGKLRSVHNTYFTLPVLFTMISNHYAMTFGARWNWLVLIAVCAAGALLRAWFVARHRADERGGATPPWPAIAGVAVLAAVVIALAPRDSRAPPGAGAALQPAQRFARIRSIIQARCVVCHAAAPTQPGFATAPKGVLFDTPEQILAQLPVIQTQLASGAMPIGNLTGMTDGERSETLDWIAHGAVH
jgi:uncharacterized membrane protein